MDSRQQPNSNLSSKIPTDRPPPPASSKRKKPWWKSLFNPSKTKTSKIEDIIEITPNLSTFNMIVDSFSRNVDDMESSIDIMKRDALVKKYDLLNFPNSGKRIFMNVHEFFDGNDDLASIAPNLTFKPPTGAYYTIFDKISKQTNVTDVLVEINDVMIYENNELNESEWFFADNIYVIGEVTKEEIQEMTKNLHPDEVSCANDDYLINLNPKYKGKKIICVWWD